MYDAVRDAFTPNKSVADRARYVILGVLVTLLLMSWVAFPIKMIPKLPQVLAAFPVLWNEGIVFELWTSLRVIGEALICSAVISLALSYLTVLQVMRPVAEGVGKLRFLGLTGLTLPFTIIFGGGEPLKVAILTFGMTTYFVTSMANEVANIPRGVFDHARSIRMSEWQVVKEVIIYGKADRAFEITRQIAAMGWMMVTFVESVVRSGGGVGSVIISMNKQMDKMPEVYAVLIIILFTAILQDWAISALAKYKCPWAFITLERR